MVGDKRKASDVDEPESERPFLKRSSTFNQSDALQPNGVLFADGSAQLSSISTQTNRRSDSVILNSIFNPHTNGTKSPIPPSNSNGFVPKALMSSMSSDHPDFSDFHSKLTIFCKTYGSIFGSAYVGDLKEAHWQVASSNDFKVITDAGVRFVQTLSRYIQDLQQAAVQQLQWRNGVLSIGMSKEALAAVDVVLSQLDSHIVGLGAEMESLDQEVAALQLQYREILESSAMM